MKTTYLITIFVALTQKSSLGEFPGLISQKQPVLSFTELASQYGHKAKRYDVITEDGYILGLFHIPGRRIGPGLPILLMHGVADTSDTWLLRGNTSLGITLVNKGYDVWFGNVRGNKYSRQHKTLNPDKNAAFWYFSFHESGYYDLRVIIDTILLKTGAGKINAIGHSQGTTIFYVLMSLKPEYNRKVNALIGLAPICYLSHIPPPLSILVKLAPEINILAKALNMNELFGSRSFTGIITDILCDTAIVGYPVCAFGAIFPVAGFDIKQFGPKFYRRALKHFPSTTSRKNLYHFAQVSRRRSFARYDYGKEENLQIYNSTMPPNYDLNKVTMPITLIVGNNDKIAVKADVDTLRAQLPNVKKYILIERKLMNHLDFIWGEDMQDYLFPHIFCALGEK